MTVAFVFSGGASLGAIHAGMAKALEDEGVIPDMIVGTSVGAINGAWFAGGGNADGLADIWRSIRRSQLFPMRPLGGLRAMVGLASNFVPNSGLRRLLESHIRFTCLEDAATRMIIVTTDAQTGHEVLLHEGNAIESILASAALPGVFPPIEINGRPMIDGGVANNTPITTAIEAGATEVWVLSTGYSCRLSEAPRKAIELAMHSVALLVQQRLVLETRDRIYAVPVHLIPPPCPISVTPTDFSQTDQLIDRSYAGTKQWLSNGRPFSLPLHVHGQHVA